MQTLQEYTAAATTYVAALLALFVEHSTTIVQWLGFVLLIARLIQELPRAATVVYKTFNRTTTKTTTGTVTTTVETSAKRSG